MAYTTNSADQYSAVGAVAPTHDANGNLTSDGTFTYGYDAENRLVLVSLGGSTVATYAYDAQGRRKLRSTGGTTTVFVTDGEGREVLEYDGTGGQVQRWYAYGPGANEVAARMEIGAATRESYVPDILGSVVGAMASDTGALTLRRYQPYCEGAGAVLPFAFTGQRLDAEAGGLHYFRARHYHPGLGRFLQADPIGYQGGINLYAYVGNDPLNRIDPLGLSPAESGSSQSSLIQPVQYMTPSGPLGIPLPIPAPIPGIATTEQIVRALERELRRPDYTYQTYTRENIETGQVYIGRTGGRMDPLSNILERNRTSELNSQGFSPPDPDRSSESYSAIRGREQQLIDAYGSIGSPRIANRINGISPFNTLGPHYNYRAEQEFGMPSPR